MDQRSRAEKASRRGSLAIDPDASPSESELRAAQLVANQGRDVLLKSPTGRRSPSGGTADLLVDGVAYDIYCPRTASIARIVSAVASKGNQAYGVVLDLTETTVPRSQLADILVRVRRTGSRIQDVIVVGR